MNMPDLAQLQHDIKALDKGDEASRRQAILSLKNQKENNWASVPNPVMHALVTALQAELGGGMKQPSIRQDITTILGNLGPLAEAAVPQLVELLQAGNPDALCAAAATALGKIGKEAKPAVGPLVQLTSSGRPTVVVHAVRALSDIGCADQRVQTALLTLWSSSSDSQKSQIQVAIALCKLKIAAKGLLKALTATLMTSPDTSMRQSAAEALGWCNKNETDVVPALLTAALHDKAEEVRQIAEKGLAHLKLSHPDAIGVCAKQLMESPYAEAALRNSGQPAVPALIGALATTEPLAREKAARILGSFGELAVEAVPALTSALRDKDLNVRLAAAKSLWNVTKVPDAVIPVLADLLEDKWAAAVDPGEPRRRFLQSVIESIGRIGQPAKAAIPALASKAKDKNRHISESAVAALKEITPPVPTKAGSR